MLKTKTIVLNGANPEAKRGEILDYFHKTFSLYQSLFECLSSDAGFYVRANPLRHPLIFYYGHTAVFFINKLNVAGLINERIDPALESLCAIGVDEMSWDDLNEAIPESVNNPEELEAIIMFLRNLEIDVIDASEVDRYKQTSTPGQEEELSDEEKTDAKLDILDDPVRMYLKQMGQVPLLTR